LTHTDSFFQKPETRNINPGKSSTGSNKIQKEKSPRTSPEHENKQAISRHTIFHAYPSAKKRPSQKTRQAHNKPVSKKSAQETAQTENEQQKKIFLGFLEKLCHARVVFPKTWDPSPGLFV
jgi:RNA recognition motif-containing protein